MLFTEGSLELRGVAICRKLSRSQRRGPAPVDASAACLRQPIPPAVTGRPNLYPDPLRAGTTLRLCRNTVWTDWSTNSLSS
jgi:hypothetical protein